MDEKATRTLLGEKARKAIRRGVNAIYNPVRLTLGPEGGNSLMYRTYGRGPRITNDGVTISEVIEPQDEFESLAAGAFKEASKRTNERVGDGTTSTIVIGGKLLNEVFDTLGDDGGIRTKNAGGKNGVMQIKKRIIEEGIKVEQMILDRTTLIQTDVTDLYKIAKVSVENEEIGKKIADMVWETGVNGFVDVIEGHKTEIETETIYGMRFAAKVAQKAFVNNPARFEMVATEAHVIVTNYAIDNINILKQAVSQLNATKIIICAPSFSDPILVALLHTMKQGGPTYFPVKTPALRTEQYEDLAEYCGATFINKDKGAQLNMIKDTFLGFLDKLIVKDTDAREEAVATGGKGLKTGMVGNRITILKEQMEETKQEIHKKLLERRIASLGSAVGVIKVGAPSVAEGLYLLKKVEDAVYACRAALQEGYVKGGGLCLKEIAEELGEDNILYGALMAPYNQIMENAEEVFEISEDIIDPAKVVRLSVGHAISVVAHLVTVKIIIPMVRDRNPAEGYSDIAHAITEYVTIYNKQHSILTQAELEQAREIAETGEENMMKDQMGL